MKETVCLIAAVRYFLYLQACGRTDRFVLLGLAMLLLMCFVVCFCSSTQTYIITNLKSAAFKHITIWKKMGILYLPLASAGVLLFGILLYIAFTRMGLGTPFPSQAYTSLSPLLSRSSLDIVAELDTPPGNIAVSS